MVLLIPSVILELNMFLEVLLRHFKYLLKNTCLTLLGGILFTNHYKPVS